MRAKYILIEVLCILLEMSFYALQDIRMQQW